ncbi:hypothetical protein SPHINGO8BC_51347 [Sphingobacterium multivorum]|uniref:Uncharacterized protein n=1 Tax=Sphingobacterium multivorum TaxID=28454 RepID=A0A654CXQ4_SPHMU|nr:hypothetical protein SPHINGO8BC_51347 [Sphingobacterium multivorum]
MNIALISIHIAIKIAHCTVGNLIMVTFDVRYTGEKYLSESQFSLSHLEPVAEISN